MECRVDRSAGDLDVEAFLEPSHVLASPVASESDVIGKQCRLHQMVQRWYVSHTPFHISVRAPCWHGTMPP